MKYSQKGRNQGEGWSPASDLDNISIMRIQTPTHRSKHQRCEGRRKDQCQCGCGKGLRVHQNREGDERREMILCTPSAEFCNILIQNCPVEALSFFLGVLVPTAICSYLSVLLAYFFQVLVACDACLLLSLRICEVLCHLNKFSDVAISKRVLKLTINRVISNIENP